LAVDYSNVIANRISDVEVAGRGTPGRPLPNLNWPQVDGTPVMTSEYSIHVAARIDGYIKFAEAGNYELRILSNDGVRLMIGGSTVLADPTVHTSRLAGPVTLTIRDAGWYNLSLLYFQKAGSAVLELHWRRPGQSDFEAVPDAAFAHARSSTDDPDGVLKWQW
jgi:urease alpha subunit